MVAQVHHGLDLSNIVANGAIPEEGREGGVRTAKDAEPEVIMVEDPATTATVEPATVVTVDPQEIFFSLYFYFAPSGQFCKDFSLFSFQ